MSGMKSARPTRQKRQPKKPIAWREGLSSTCVKKPCRRKSKKQKNENAFAESAAVTATFRHSVSCRDSPVGAAGFGWENCHDGGPKLRAKKLGTKAFENGFIFCPGTFCRYCLLYQKLTAREKAE
jgi:hypothetical protein